MCPASDAALRRNDRSLVVLNKGVATQYGAFSAIPRRAVAILSDMSDHSNCVTPRSNRVTMSLSACLVIEQNDLQQAQL